MSATVGAHGLVAGDEAVPLFLGEFAVDDRAGLLDEAGDVERNLDHLARSRQPQGVRLGAEVTWSWEHDGPGSNSLATAWPVPSEAQ